MIDVDVVLAVAAYPDSYLVIKRGQEVHLPSVRMSPGDRSDALVVKLFYDILGFDVQAWARLMQAGFVEEGGKYMVLYGVQLPDTSPIASGLDVEWMTVEGLDPHVETLAVKLLLRSIKYKE